MERRRMGGCRDTSEFDRLIGAFVGWTGSESRRQAGLLMPSSFGS